jgi:hypothetical protein
MAANSVGTGQLAALSGTSQLIGSNSSSSTATNITLGTGLSMSSGGVLSATAVAPAPATSTSLGTIQLAGSLSGTATAPTIANNAIGTAQLANNAVGTAQLANGAVGISQLAPLPATSELIGSSSGSTTASAITLGSGLAMSAGGQLSVNLTGVPIPAATSSSLGGIEMLGDLTGSSATAPTVAAGAITLAKMANLSGNSQLIGSNSTSTTPTNITLGPSMSMTSSQLNSGVSYLTTGNNPNTTAPSDRPATQKVLYIGTDGSLWIYNGTNYIKSNGPGSVVGTIVPSVTNVTLGNLVVQIGGIVNTANCSIFAMFNDSQTHQCTASLFSTYAANGASQNIGNMYQSISGTFVGLQKVWGGGFLNQVGGTQTFVLIDQTFGKQWNISASSIASNSFFISILSVV